MTTGTPRNVSLAAPLAALAAVLAAGAPGAHATTELNAQYSGRSVGMGGTGVALIDDAAALYLNPALLDGITELSLSAQFLGVGYQLGAPFLPDRQDTSTTAVAPYFLVGGGYRLNRQLVVGFAVFPTVGVGTTYEGVAALGGNDAMVQVASIEAAPGISYAITPQLSIGATYRATYTASNTQLAVPTDDGFAPVKQDVSGTSLLGASLGAVYRPSAQLALGINYRTRTSASLSGTQTVGGLPAQDIEQKFATPHELRAGGALRLLEDRLIVALDARAVFYHQSNKQLVTTLRDPPPGTPDEAKRTVVEQDWHDVFAAGAGAEYAVTDTVRLRAGLAVTSSATPEDHASPFVAPPALIASYHLGAGLRIARWQLDAGAFVSSSSTRIANDSYPMPPNPTPGRYSFTIVAATLAASYRL